MTIQLTDSQRNSYIDTLKVDNHEGSLWRNKRLVEFYDSLSDELKIFIVWMYDHKGHLFIGYDSTRSTTPKLLRFNLLMLGMDGFDDGNVDVFDITEQPEPGAHWHRDNNTTTFLSSSDSLDVIKAYQTWVK